MYGFFSVFSFHFLASGHKPCRASQGLLLFGYSSAVPLLQHSVLFSASSFCLLFRFLLPFFVFFCLLGGGVLPCPFHLALCLGATAASLVSLFPTSIFPPLFFAYALFLISLSL